MLYIFCFFFRFKLSPDVIIHSMPLVDTSKTAIEDMCPAFLKPVKCPVSRYRTLSGMCNNLDNPSWGSSRSAFVRFLPPVYGDCEYLKFLLIQIFLVYKNFDI